MPPHHARDRVVEQRGNHGVEEVCGNPEGSGVGVLARQTVRGSPLVAFGDRFTG